MLRSRRSRLVIGAAVLCVLILGGYLVALWYNRDACSDEGSIQYLDSLCTNYSSGLITGSLCEPLCETREILFRRCLGHGVKLHVLQATWREETVILKTPKSLGTESVVSSIAGIIPHRVARKDFKMSGEDFTKHAGRHILLNYMKGQTVMDKTTLATVQGVLRECDLRQDDSLSYPELITCWQLVYTAEYVLYSLLRDNVAVPDILGVCGNMYAVEYAASAPFLGFTSSLFDGRSWEFRSDLAVALLDMVEVLENTSYGTLYLCDVQESNFGVVWERSGKLRAKAIDVDIAMFESTLLSQLNFERNMSCKVDNDCFMISCGGKCSKITRKCAGILTSSNLVTLCRRILRQRFRVHAALLRNPPHHIRDELDLLLEKCSEYGPSHIDRHLLHQLRHLLRQSSGQT